ncbi:bifunctional NlpC domain lipoprotein/C40 family peptidase [Enterococcus faecalis M7]|nr:bifunctional NlpC domain lipoprotein/C40 family peptidase [Enterococcus faecalis M7]
MKLKILYFGSSFFLSLLGLLLTSLLLFSTDQDSSASTEPSETQLSVSQEVLNYQKLVNKYAKENHISEYSDYLLAIMQVETGGKGQDVMQSSESLGLAPNSLSPEASIKQACIYFSQMVTKMKREDSDIESVVQSYNYGSGFLDYVIKNGKNIAMS